MYLRTITIVECDNAHKLDCKLCPLQEFILKISSKGSAKLGIQFLPLLKNDQNARNLFMLDTPALHTRWEQISDLLSVHRVLSMLGHSTHLGPPPEPVQKILRS